MFALCLLENPLLLWTKFNAPLETLEIDSSLLHELRFLKKRQYMYFFKKWKLLCLGGSLEKTVVLLCCMASMGGCCSQLC